MNNTKRWVLWFLLVNCWTWGWFQGTWLRVYSFITHIIQRRKLKYRKVKKIPKFSSRLLVKVKDDSGAHNMLNIPIFHSFWDGYKVRFPQISLFYQHSVTVLFPFPATINNQNTYLWIHTYCRTPDQGSANYRPQDKFSLLPVFVQSACQEYLFIFKCLKKRQKNNNIRGHTIEKYEFVCSYMVLLEHIHAH